MRSPAWGHLREFICVRSPVWSHLCEVTCVRSPVWVYLREVTSVESPAWGHLCEVTCVSLSAWGHLREVTCVRSPVWVYLREVTGVESPVEWPREVTWSAVWVGDVLWMGAGMGGLCFHLQNGKKRKEKFQKAILCINFLWYKTSESLNCNLCTWQPSP
jgi:hypothetical protein